MFPHIMSKPSNCDGIENIIVYSILFYCHIRETVCWYQSHAIMQRKQLIVSYLECNFAIDQLIYF